MTTLHLVGWQKGLKTVSLIAAIRRSSGLSLFEAKRAVERLLDGERIELIFATEVAAKEFQREATGLGVLF